MSDSNGLDYRMSAWRAGEADPFHTEVGYWLWDADGGHVLRCFMVPRGTTVLAGGTARPDASSFALEANVGSETYGILSNLYLAARARTTKYTCNVVTDANVFSYESCTTYVHATTGCEMVIGSRFVNGPGTHSGLVRAFGIRFFRIVLRPILGKPVHDPTSGFVGVNRRALEVFSRSFPLEYPEIEALVVLQRRRFRFEEMPCKMRPRLTGRSSITALKSLYYIAHVLLGVFVNVLKYDGRTRWGAGGPNG